MATKALTAKQQRFCQEYMVDLNASAAARRAGYSTKTAGIIGFQNLRKPAISAEISKLVARVVPDLDVSEKTLVALLGRMAHADVRALFNEDGTTKLPHELDPITAAALAGVEVTQKKRPDGLGRVEIEQTAKFKMVDRVKAIETLLKVHGAIGGNGSGGTGKFDSDVPIEPAAKTPLDRMRRLHFLLHKAKRRRDQELREQMTNGGAT